MDRSLRSPVLRWSRLGIPILVGLIALVAALGMMRTETSPVHADPIDPPQGYPKLKLSVKTVTPTLANVGGAGLTYLVEIRNTGAYTAAGATFSDTLPSGTSFVTATASSGPSPVYAGGLITWAGDVGFDQTVVLSLSVDVSQNFSGTIQNTAVISHPLIAEPVWVTAESVVTNDPLLTVSKSSAPPIPGAGKLMVYTLVVANQGQTATNLPITVTDHLPVNTEFDDVGPDGAYNLTTDEVVWTRNINLALGETTAFTFSVKVSDNVLSGTVITNDTYEVASATGSWAGEVHTVTVRSPEFLLSKEIRPDPPGSNRDATYILTLLNLGSQATDLVVTDTVPAGVTYVDGGVEASGVVSWSWPSLNTFESAQFTYTIRISDVAGIQIVNDDFAVCSAESACHPGTTLYSTIGPPTFVTFARVDPIAHKPGGGTGTEVTPTLSARNIGPGNALSATAVLLFDRISVSANDLRIITAAGTLVPAPLPDGPYCGSKCKSYLWRGDLGVGEIISFTTVDGQSTIGGSSGTLYTATIVITDSLANMTTEPATAEAIGLVTHDANLIPTKSAPRVIGPGQFMTYTIEVVNSGLSTDEPPSPWLTDTVPLSVTVVSISHGGISMTSASGTVISWTLPAMSPGDELERAYGVRVDANLISGTQIINDDYQATWYELDDKLFLSGTGTPVTTTVREVGLIDSFKRVEPSLVSPGPGNILTYTLHIVNSGPISLTGVTAYDWLPWQWSTYQRDAIASTGSIISDIVSIEWTGDVDAYSEEVITLTVLVDADFEGTITNTATISHTDLREEVVVGATGYVTDDPVLQVSKSAAPDPVKSGGVLAYQIDVTNLGQQATSLLLTDTLPAGTSYISGSASAGGHLVGSVVIWEFPLLKAGQSRSFNFQVRVSGIGETVVNDRYGVLAAGGFVGMGDPVITHISLRNVYLPAIIKD